MISVAVILALALAVTLGALVVLGMGAAQMLEIERRRTDNAEAGLRQLLATADVDTPIYDRLRRVHDEFAHDIDEIRNLPEAGQR